MDIDKIQFGQLSSAGKIDKSFEDLDVNNDGKINEQDESLATNAEIKNAISQLLASDIDEEPELADDAVFDTTNQPTTQSKSRNDRCEEFMNTIGSYFDEYVSCSAQMSNLKLHGGVVTQQLIDRQNVARQTISDICTNCFEEIYNSGNFDLNDDGKVDFEDLVMAEKLREKARSRGSIIPDNMNYPDKIWRAIKKELDTKYGITQPKAQKFDVSKINELYDLFLNTASKSDSNKAVNSRISGTMIKLIIQVSEALNHNTDNEVIQGSKEDIAKFKEILLYLQDSNSEIRQAIKNGTTTCLSPAFRLTISTIFNHIENNEATLGQIKSQLVDGKIPEGQTITVDTNTKNIGTIPGYTGSLEVFARGNENSLRNDVYWAFLSYFAKSHTVEEFGNINAYADAMNAAWKLVKITSTRNEQDGTASVSATDGNGFTFNACSSNSYSQYTSQTQSKRTVSVTNKNGEYIYIIDGSYTEAFGTSVKQTFYLTDEMIDKIAEYYEKTGGKGGYAGVTLNMYAIADILGATQIIGEGHGGAHESRAFRFTNIFGEDQTYIVGPDGCNSCIYPRQLSMAINNALRVRNLLKQAENEARNA